MLIYIRSLTGRKLEYDVEPSSYVLTLKERIQEKEGINLDQIRLILGGRQLQDSDTFISINPGTVIHCILQLRGG